MLHWQVVQRHLDIKQEILRLAINMQATFRFIRCIDDLHDKIQSLEDEILPSLLQAIETSAFIQDYLGHGFLGIRELATDSLKG